MEERDSDVEALRREALREGRRQEAGGEREEIKGKELRVECPLPQGCGQTKDAGDFETDKRTKTGFSKYCKECLGRMRGVGPKPDPPGPDPAGLPERMKRCFRCEKMMPLGQFSPDKKSPDGVRYYCKPCTAAISREYSSKHSRKAGDEQGEGARLEALRPQARRGEREEKKPAKIPSLCIEVNFNQFPYLHEFILSGQERFLRSPENMIIYAVKRFMDLVDCRKGE